MQSLPNPLIIYRFSNYRLIRSNIIKLFQKKSFIFSKEPIGLFPVIGPPDIKPVTAEFVNRWRAIGFNQRVDQIGKIKDARSR